MNARTTIALTGVFAAMLMAPHAQAQCPTSPLSTLAGTWVFSTDGFAVQPNLRFLGAGGRFTASVGTDRAGNPLGVLSITQTTANDNTITRLETDAGRFQLNSDCSGGTLTFNTSSRPVQFDFFFVNSTELVLVGSNNGDVIIGTARLATGTQTSCPATPAQLINGTWIFDVEGFDLTRVNPEIAAAGRFVVNGSILMVTQTAGVNGGNVRMETETGRVFLNDDCSGGSLFYAIGGRPVQFDFFFSGPNRIVLSGTTGSDIITGEARRAGSTI